MLKGLRTPRLRSSSWITSSRSRARRCSSTFTSGPSGPTNLTCPRSSPAQSAYDATTQFTVDQVELVDKQGRDHRGSAKARVSPGSEPMAHDNRIAAVGASDPRIPAGVSSDGSRSRAPARRRALPALLPAGDGRGVPPDGDDGSRLRLGGSLRERRLDGRVLPDARQRSGIPRDSGEHALVRRGDDTRQRRRRGRRRHALEKYDLPFRRGLVAALSFPIALPGIVVAFLIVVLIGRSGLVTNALAALVGGDPSRWRRPRRCSASSSRTSTR